MIHFITPFIRTENFHKILDTLNQNLQIDFQWYLIYKPELNINTFIANFNVPQVIFCPIEYTTPWGHEQRNFYIDNYANKHNHWCYFLDDDNIPSPDLIYTYKKYQNNYIYDLIVLSQKAGSTDMTRLCSEDGCLTLGRCDIGSFLIRGSLLSRTRLHLIDQRNCDGHMAEDLERITPRERILYLSDKFTYYNALSDKEIF